MAALEAAPPAEGFILFSRFHPERNGYNVTDPEKHTPSPTPTPKFF